GGRTRRPWERAGDRAGPDDESGSLCGAAGGDAGLQRVLCKGAEFPAHDVVSAVQRDGERAGAEREKRNGDADEQRVGDPAESAGGEAADYGSGGGPGATAEE